MPLPMPRAGARMLSARGFALCFRQAWAPLARQGRLGGAAEHRLKSLLNWSYCAWAVCNSTAHINDLKKCADAPYRTRAAARSRCPCPFR